MHSTIKLQREKAFYQFVQGMLNLQFQSLMLFITQKIKFKIGTFALLQGQPYLDCKFWDDLMNMDQSQSQ